MPQLIAVHICRCRNCRFSMRTESSIGGPAEAEHYAGRYLDTHALMFRECPKADFYYEEVVGNPENSSAAVCAGQLLTDAVGADAMIRELRRVRADKAARGI